MNKPTEMHDPLLVQRLQEALAEPAPVRLLPDAYRPATTQPVRRRRKRFPWLSVTLAAIGQVILALVAGVHLVSGTIAALVGVGYFLVSVCFVGAETMTILEQDRGVTR